MVVRWVPPYIDYCWLGIKERLLSVRSRERALYSQKGTRPAGRPTPLQYLLRGAVCALAVYQHGDDLCLLDALPRAAPRVSNARQQAAYGASAQTSASKTNQLRN